MPRRESTTSVSVELRQECHCEFLIHTGRNHHRPPTIFCPGSSLNCTCPAVCGTRPHGGSCMPVPPVLRHAARYGLAIACIATAVLIRLLLTDLIGRESPFLLC